jgi:mRNA interferase YafQ
MKLKRHKQFLKEWAKTKLTDGQFEKFIEFAGRLKKDVPLPPESRDHSLSGEYNDCREFHLGGDILIIYREELEKKETTFLRLGSHSQLFK